MAFITTIEDDKHRKLVELHSTHDCYRFADGSGMFVGTSPAWCHDCRAFVMVEDLEDPAEMESRVRDFCADRGRNPLIPSDIVSKDDQREMTHKMLAHFLHAAEQWRAALRQRASPPRCLECGGTSFTVIPENETWVPHPGAPGRRVRVSPDQCHAQMAYQGRVYDTEGRRLAD